MVLFDTAVGRCAVAWRDPEQGVTGVALPASCDAATLASVLPVSASVLPLAEAPAPVAEAVRRVSALLSGAVDDLCDVRVDLDGVPGFAAAVYAAARRVGPGETTSYGALAREIGEPGAARAVGRALGANPVPVIVPCHRVLAADGRPGGFSAPGGLATKDRLLSIERRSAGVAPTLFD